MIVACKHCRKQINIEGGIEEGDVVPCPYCGESFVFSAPVRVALSGVIPSPPQDSGKEAPRPKPVLRLRRPSEGDTPAGEGASAFIEQVESRIDKDLRRKERARAKAIAMNVFVMLLLAVAAFFGWKYWHVRQVVRAEFAALKNGFAGAQFALWHDLPRQLRPGRAKGTFGLVIPDEAGQAVYYRLDSDAGKIFVRRLLSTGVYQAIPAGEYRRRVLERGGIFQTDGIAYVVVPDKKTQKIVAPAGQGAVLNPSEAFLGDLYPLLEKFGIKGGNRHFEVYFAPNASAQPVRVARAGFGATVPYAAFAEVARDYVPRASKPGRRLTDMKPRQTVVFYDGHMIARGLNGVVRVPRTLPTAFTSTEANRWQRLANEATRQEAALRAYESRQRGATSGETGSDGDESDVQAVLRNGIVTIKCK